jgi:hypothetical protein
VLVSLQKRVGTEGVNVNTYVPNIDAAQAQHLGPRAHFGDLSGGLLGLLDAAANDAGVGTEMDQGAGLSAADGAGTAGDEEDTAGWEVLAFCDEQELE